MQEFTSFSGLFTQYQDTRQINKYENYALWTIPSAFPDNFNFSNKYNADVEHDYQSIGAMLVNSLATKLAELLFPVNQSFFRIEFTEEMQKKLMSMKGFDQKLAEKELIDIERKACRGLFRNAAYAQLVQMLRYLIITGNALVHRFDNSLTVYSPRNFVLLRDNRGSVLDIVVKESIAKGSLPQDVQQLPCLLNKKEFDDVCVYTRIKREYVGKKSRTKWVVSQQIEDIPIGKVSTYPERLCPYVPVGWNLINGDSYCRGHVEDHAGDFAKMSDLSRALALYQLDACKVVNLVKPGAVVDIDKLEEAVTGEWCQADPDAVKKHEGGEYQKMVALANEISVIYQRLSAAFMHQGNMRDAERVTATEIQFNAAEADKALGGVYSQLAEWIHLPLAYLLSYEVEPKLIAAFANSEVQMQVLTGIAALGRTADVDALIKATNVLNAIIQPLKQVSQRFDTELIVDRVMQSYGLNPEDWMLDEKAMAEQAAAAQQAVAAADPLQNQQAIQGVI